MSERPFNPYEGCPTILIEIAEYLMEHSGGDNMLDYLNDATELMDRIFDHEEFPYAVEQRKQDAFKEMPA